MNHFSIGLWCAAKSGLYMTTSDDQLSGWMENKFQSSSQSQSYTKKGHAHCSVVVYCWPDPLQLSESWQNHYIWKLYSANRWDALKTAMPAAGIGQQNGPNSSLLQCPTTHHTTKASKVEQTGLRSFASSSTFAWPLTNWLTLQASWQLFAGKTLPQPVGCRKCFPKISSEPEAQIFML